MSNSCNPMDCSLPGSSVHGILQARILERVTISFSKGSSCPGIEPGWNLGLLHCRQILTDLAMREAKYKKKCNNSAASLENPSLNFTVPPSFTVFSFPVLFHCIISLLSIFTIKIFTYLLVYILSLPSRMLTLARQGILSFFFFPYYCFPNIKIVPGMY